MKPRPLGKRRLIKHLDHLERKDGGSIKIWFYGQGYTFYDVKSACDFYWKYRNAPQKLWSDGVLSNDKKNELISKFLAPIDSGAYGVSKRKILDKYNEWLFKFTFKDVLGDED